MNEIMILCLVCEGSKVSPSTPSISCLCCKGVGHLTEEKAVRLARIRKDLTDRLSGHSLEYIMAYRLDTRTYRIDRAIPKFHTDEKGRKWQELGKVEFEHVDTLVDVTESQMLDRLFALKRNNPRQQYKHTVMEDSILT